MKKHSPISRVPFPRSAGRVQRVPRSRHVQLNVPVLTRPAEIESMSVSMNKRGSFSPSFFAAGFLLAASLSAQDARTPRAGEAWTETVFGKTISAAARDRTSVTAIVLSAQWIPGGLEQRVLVPSGGLFFWRNRQDGAERLRADIAVLANDARYNRRLVPSGLEAALTFENVTLPFARSEYVEGRRVAAEELKWNFVRAGAGIGYRRTLSPGRQDNAFEAALTGASIFAFGRTRWSATSWSFPMRASRPAWTAWPGTAPIGKIGEEESSVCRTRRRRGIFERSASTPWPRVECRSSREKGTATSPRPMPDVESTSTGSPRFVWAEDRTRATGSLSRRPSFRRQDSRSSFPPDMRSPISSTATRRSSSCTCRYEGHSRGSTVRASRRRAPSRTAQGRSTRRRPV